MPIDAFSALSRFGLGARPGDVELVGGDVVAALIGDLEAGPAPLDDEGLPERVEVLRAIEAARRERMAGRKAGAPHLDAFKAEVAARVARYRREPIGLCERLVAFWTNHFAVEARRSALVRGLAGAFEREAIRPHVLGRFEDMLVAATQHPAMLAYLDNAGSVGPDSRLGRRRGIGLNENLAREVMELHTLGVDGGYTQADVTAFAKVLTGWTYGRERDGNVGGFVFRAAAHEPGPQRIRDIRYDQPDGRQGLAVLADLARAPATADHIAQKLARHFVADAPPQALVDRLATRFRKTDGDLMAVSRTLVRARAAHAAPVAKLKSPQEFLWSAMRATGVELEVPVILRALQALGQPVWEPPSPEGFGDTTDAWLAPDALTTRVDIADRIGQRVDPSVDVRAHAAALAGSALSEQTIAAIERAESARQGMVLLLMSPEFQRR